jgi:GTP cyclohydrolase I
MSYEIKTESLSASVRKNKALPDVSLAQKTLHKSTLSQVGMGKIELPILFSAEKGENPILLPAEIDAFVSLDNPQAKGIHMSRLYLELKSSLQAKPLSAAHMHEILKNFIRTHEGLSESAYLKVRFQLPVERKALLSGEIGFRHYPVEWLARLQNKKFDFILSADILYSSTCPCSAALARQLVQNQFEQKFAGRDKVSKSEMLAWLGREEAIMAVPHAQRSVAKLRVRLNPKSKDFQVMDLIDMAEKSLGTPVQSAVKRVDEQEFARLNAKNLMFCEDAARKLRGAFEKTKVITDYDIYVEHQESLHPHNAVSRVVKGVKNGFIVW